MFRIVVDSLPAGSNISELLDFQTRYMIHNHKAHDDATMRKLNYDGTKAVAEVYYEFDTEAEAALFKLGM